MIGVHSRNAKQSDGQVRLESMAGLRAMETPFGNKKILTVLGGMTAFVLYMRSFLSPNAAMAEMNENKQDEEAVGELAPEGAEGKAAEDSPTRLSTRRHEYEETEARSFSSEDPAPIYTWRGGDFELQTFDPQAFLRPVDAPDIPGARSTIRGPQDEVAPASPQATSAGAAATEDKKADPTEDRDDEDDDRDDDRTTTEPDHVGGETDIVDRDDADKDDKDDCGSGSDCDHAAADADCTDTATAECSDDHGDDEETCAQAEDAVADCDSCAEVEQETPPVMRSEIHGTDLADQITGSDEAEEIIARAGDDTIDAGGGADLIFGDDGDDVILAGDGDDAVMGGDDNDTIDAGAGHDLVMGEDGNDALAGGEGDDLILGGKGDDDLSGGAGNDRMIGEDGDDILRDGEGADVMLGGAGDDWFHLATDVSADLLNGGDGFDTLLLPDDAIQSRTDAAAGTVTIDGNPADTFENIERIVAGNGNDEFDFSGLQQSQPETDAPRFFQITDFGLGDTLRLSNDFTLGLSELGDNDLWSQPDGQSDLQARMQTASPDNPDAGMTRLAFRTGQDEDALTRTIEFDVNGDGKTDFTVAVSVLEVELNDQNFHA